MMRPSRPQGAVYRGPARLQGRSTRMNDPSAHPKRRGLARLLFGGVLAVIIAAATAAMLPGVAKAAAISGVQSGTNGGMYFQMWNNGQGSACITLNSPNSYSSPWSDI